jgi:hypothetical protein
MPHVEVSIRYDNRRIRAAALPIVMIRGAAIDEKERKFNLQTSPFTPPILRQSF